MRPSCRSATAAVVLAAALAACSNSEFTGAGGRDTAAPAIVPAFPALTFSNPLFLTQAPGDDTRMFVVTQGGVIHVFENRDDVASAKVFLDLSDRVTQNGGELGLLGLAFDPGYADNGFFYVNYNPDFDPIGINPRRTLIARFQVTSDPDVADPDSETVLLSYDQPFDNHNGGWLAFGPDGKLYIASGDGGSLNDPANNAQNLGTPLGKILRIDADGSIPPDNPFVGQQGARGEIWAYGLRNPYRCSFDRATGTLWAGDVGQDMWEEIDHIVKGGNYGWRKFEGNHDVQPADPDPGNAVGPVFEYAHEEGRCSITGGYVYRGAALPSAAGRYFYADYCSGEVWSFAGGTSTPVGTVPTPTSFGEDHAGELYITSFDGHLYRLAPGP